MHAIALALIVLLLSAVPSPVDAAPKKEKRQVMQQGLGLYRVFLDDAVVANEDATHEPPARSLEDPRNRFDELGWQKPKTRAAVKRLQAKYRVEATAITSYSLPSFFTFMPEHTAEALRHDPSVNRVEVVHEGGGEFSSWGNRVENGETVPWGKIAVGTDDSYDFTGSQNVIYMIDGAALLDGSYNTHPDVNLEFAQVNLFPQYIDPPTRLAPGHANHVAGILGAKRGTSGVRGIAPGIKIWNVIVGTSPEDFARAVNWIVGHVGDTKYGVASLSQNGDVYTPGGTFYIDMVKLRERVFIAQSAGNHEVDACAVAYHPTGSPADPLDGVMVVGGINEEGREAGEFTLQNAFDNSGAGYTSYPGSNFGTCIEAWAPSTNILSTWNDGLTKTLSGTSMAAPHVAALAARYGTTSTTPAERESYIRSILSSTGFLAQLGRKLGVPSATGHPTMDVPRLTNVSTRAQVLAGDSMMFGGFVISGTTNKTIVARVRGPSLAPHGITNPLANPLLQLVRSSDQQIIAGNDDWRTGGNAAAIEASGFQPADDLESAILITLAPGAYTSVVYGYGGGTGTAIFEVFEVDAPATPFANLSTRARVGTGNDLVIAGFTITGSGVRDVIIRGRGPSLAPYLPGTQVLADPYLQVVRSSDQATIGTNDNWTGPDYQLVIDSEYVTNEDEDSIVRLRLPAGAYTAKLTGVGGGVGVAIVEVFAP